MKQHWTEVELRENWSLSSDEQLCVNSKNHKLVYALKMKYFDLHGHFLDDISTIPLVVRNYVAQLVVGNSSDNPVEDYQWRSRSAQIHNNEIREYYGYKKFDTSCLLVIKELIENSLLAQGLSTNQIIAKVYQHLKKLKIIPPSAMELKRRVSNLCAAYEENFFDKCYQSLTIESQNNILKLFELHNNEQTVLSFIRKTTGSISGNTANEELIKLKYIELTGILQLKHFAQAPRKLLKKYHDRVSTSSPSSLLEIKDKRRFYGLLGCFCYYKGGKILDTLVDIFIKSLHRLQNLSMSRAKQDLWEYYADNNRDELLDNLVDISLTHPDGIIKDKIYHGVGGKEKLEFSKESRKTGKQICMAFKYKHLSSFYIHHHRKYIISILSGIKLRTHISHAVLAAINFIISNEGTSKYYPDTIVVDTEIFAQADWDIILASGQVNRVYYELAALSLLRKELRCKNIWVEGAFKYSDPDKDLPQDFQVNKKSYYSSLNLAQDCWQEFQSLKVKMQQALKDFNNSIIAIDEVRIGKKAGKPHIYLTPYVAQDEPVNIAALKKEIGVLWPNLSLLDIFKEADLRIGLTQEFINVAGKTALNNTVAQERLLRCLFAIGTNTEFGKICIGSLHASEQDLWYIKKRFVTVEVLRFVIRKLVNNTLAIRDKNLWGNSVDSFASDSTKFAAWSGNLMSEYHIRYQGNGVMAYWHVEKKALCVSSQIAQCSSPEVPLMLEGVIHHATNVKVKNHSTDSHGQSLVAFAFAYLLGVELRPRIKGIGKIKLYKPDNHIAKADYCHLEDVMTRAVNWTLIANYYDEIIKYVAALKLRTAEVAVLLKRFIVDNSQSPVYKALLELGRAVRTIWACKYLTCKTLRMEVEEVLNVIENWHSGNNFIFFGKRGVISSNDENNQEISILALHLLQSSLVYINTLLIQQVLKKQHWQNRLTIEDKRAITPLFYDHINQYGTYMLDMNSRINIESV